MKLIPKFQEGGTLDERQKEILKRSEIPQTAWNYYNALDGDIWFPRSLATKLIDTNNHLQGMPAINPDDMTPHRLPTGLSNCTLTATQWVNPSMPLMKAQTIIDNGMDYGYVEIPEEHLTQGDLIIATNPENNKHHTMLNIGFTHGPQLHTFNGKQYILPDDHPLVRYSSGTTDPSSYRQSVGLKEYIDNSEGKTKIQYFRQMPKGYNVLLPEITVTPKGTYYDESEQSKMYYGK